MGTAADTVNRLPGSGTNGHVLTYDSAETTGLKWAEAPGSGGGASVGTATPLALGTASAGDDATASREDHVHPTTGLALSGHNHNGIYDPAGTAAAAIVSHEAASDPHSIYLTDAEGDAQYSQLGHTHTPGEAAYTTVVKEYVKNTSGSTINKGQAVYISGATGTNVTVAKADYDTDVTSSKTLGLMESTVAHNGFGYVVIEGILTGFDTSAASTEGVPVWLGASGNLVYGTAPSEPNHTVYIGVVSRKNSSNGEVFVKVQNGYELTELHDVSASSPSDNDVIQFDSASGYWKNESLATAGIAATSHAHSGVYDPAGTTSTHAALTSTVHGITDTANLVYTSDSRLTDARTPSSTLAHSSTHLSGGTDALSGISPSQVTGTAVVTADSRLSDARTPTAHKTSHSTGGSDALVASDIGAAATSHSHATSDITSGNFAATVSGGTGVTVTGGTGNASTPTVAIGQAVATTSNVTFANITGTGMFSAPNIARGRVTLTTIVANEMSQSLTTITGISVKTTSGSASEISILLTPEVNTNPVRTVAASSPGFTGSNLTSFVIGIFSTNTTSRSVYWLVIGS